MSPGRPRTAITAPWPIPHPDDPQHIVTLRRALREAELNQLISMLHEHLPLPPARLHAVLGTFFHYAQTHHISLDPAFHELNEFHTAILDAAQHTHTGRPAATNTVRTRLSALNSIYQALIRIGVLHTNPLTALERPTPPKRTEHLLHRRDITRLHTTARKRRHTDTNDRARTLPAALILIDEHAFYLNELLGLTWAHYDPLTHTITRRSTYTTLSRRAKAALRELAVHVGYTPLTPTPPEGPIFPWTTETDFRATLYATCAATPIPYISPRLLRLAGLRDHPTSPQNAGFTPGYGDQTLKRSLARVIPDPEDLARTLAQRLAPQ